jgi:hypothetical protein
MNRHLLALLKHPDPEVQAHARALAPKRRSAVKLLPASVAHSERRRAEEEVAGAEASAETWAAVQGRAPFRCELTSIPHITEAPEPHHLEGGRGRRQQNEGPHNVMSVCRTCHDLFHARPSRYDDRVRAWCAYYHFPLPPQVVKREIREKQKALREARSAARAERERSGA